MTFDTLLIPTDGSDPAEAAADRGFDLAAQLEASVHVLSVADSSVATGAGYSGDSASIRSRLRERADARAKSLRERATDRGLDATATVREGIPAEEIVRYADEQALDGIVIGTSGRGGVARAIVGSVADKVVRTAPVPVVTITPEAADTTAATFDSVLCPTDGSEPATTAIQRGFTLGDRLEATVHLLSVVDGDLANSLVTVSDTDIDPSSALYERAESHLDALATRGRDRGLDVVMATRDGKPAEAIVDYVETEDIDLIVMGTAGRGGFERALVGSVTDAVVRTAPVPVLTVRPDGTTDEQ
ncbi:universal stress protein [Natronolimnohabitans sp. A-GB9]|uniref:universal stress protein n=1 Tax=Natronolimnohabitans sp. A-GB9 TaxID=3069757 RepID=UPI0027B6AEC9|nr:universal stress protein [Natronolimnohabitans sp. A-GB9]MDQ2052666.1 universal stress protein [Natronolimnohabitans sp. A-GB9]